MNLKGSYIIYHLLSTYIYISRKLCITDFAQEELGEIISVDIREVREELSVESVFASLESATNELDLYSPVSGEIIEINEEVLDNPNLINHDPYENGWLIKVRMYNQEELKSLLGASSYRNFIQKEL